MFNAVLIEFTDARSMTSKDYAFLTHLDLSVGDDVIVDTQKGLMVARVTKVRGLSKTQMGRATMFVVQKIDLAGHADRIKKAEIAQEIRNKLHERKRQVEEIIIYEKMAKDDPAIAGLIDELKAIDPSFRLTMGGEQHGEA